MSITLILAQHPGQLWAARRDSTKQVDVLAALPTALQVRGSESRIHLSTACRTCSAPGLAGLFRKHDTPESVRTASCSFSRRPPSLPWIRILWSAHLCPQRPMHGPLALLETCMHLSPGWDLNSSTSNLPCQNPHLATFSMHATNTLCIDTADEVSADVAQKPEFCIIAMLGSSTTPSSSEDSRKC